MSLYSLFFLSQVITDLCLWVLSAIDLGFFPRLHRAVLHRLNPVVIDVSFRMPGRDCLVLRKKPGHLPVPCPSVPGYYCLWPLLIRLPFVSRAH